MSQKSRNQIVFNENYGTFVCSMALLSIAPVGIERGQSGEVVFYQACSQLHLLVLKAYGCGGDNSGKILSIAPVGIESCELSRNFQIIEHSQLHLLVLKGS